MLRMAVCDKEEETCSLIKALAEESIGCKVWTFHSDTELLESKEKYDILLLDIGNGEPTGIETARKIRRYIKRLRSAPRNMRWKMAISATKKLLRLH